MLCQAKTGSRTSVVIKTVFETVVFVYINFKIWFFYKIDFNQSYEITNDKEFNKAKIALLIFIHNFEYKTYQLVLRDLFLLLF